MLKLTPQQIEIQMRDFAAAYWRTADISKALEQSLIEVPITDDPVEFGSGLLERKDVKDWITLMGDDKGTGVEGLIARLDATRRMAVLKSDYRAIREIEDAVAKLRGYTQDAAPPPPARLELADLARIVAFATAAGRAIAEQPQPKVIDNATDAG